MKTKTKALAILILIIIFSLFIRIYRISEIPPSLNWDEVSHGYNAYSILKTGCDEWGEKLPLIFRAYGDYKLPLYIYLTTPAVWLFGLNNLGVRLISVLAGVGLVLVSYLITYKLTRKQSFSLLSAFLVAISPWSLFVSRAALEANLGAFLFALGVYFLIDFFLKRAENKLSLTAVFWGLSIYAYNSARVLVPIFVLFSLYIFFKKKIKFKQIRTALLLLIIFFIPVVGQIFNKTGQARFNLVNLIDEGAIGKIIEERQKSSFSPALTRLFYNRPAYFLLTASKNYVSNFSPNYLFFRGGSHYQFSQPDHELLYLVTAPFLLLGFLGVLLKGKPEERVLIFWFLVGMIPSAITRDAPHSLRTIFILPTPMIFSSLGLKLVMEKISKRSLFGGKLLVGALVFAVLVSFGKWWKDYTQVYPKAYGWAWQYGYEEMAGFVKENYEEFDRVYISKRYGEPHEFLLFYLQWEPKKYQDDLSKAWDYHDGWYWVDGFDKFIFFNDWEVVNNLKIQNLKQKSLLITSPGNYPEGWEKVKTINSLGGEAVFEIFILR